MNDFSNCQSHGGFPRCQRCGGIAVKAPPHQFCKRCVTVSGSVEFVIPRSKALDDFFAEAERAANDEAVE